MIIRGHQDQYEQYWEEQSKQARAKRVVSWIHGKIFGFPPERYPSMKEYQLARGVAVADFAPMYPVGDPNGGPKRVKEYIDVVKSSSSGKTERFRGVRPKFDPMYPTGDRDGSAARLQEYVDTFSRPIAELVAEAKTTAVSRQSENHTLESWFGEDEVNEAI